MKIKPAFEIEWDRSGCKPAGKRVFTPHRCMWGFTNHTRYQKAGNPTLNPLFIWNKRRLV